MNIKKPSDPFTAVAGFSAIGIFFGIPVVWFLFPIWDAVWLSLCLLSGYAGLLKVASYFR